MNLHLPVLPRRFWLNVHAGNMSGWYLTLGIQHRIAWPPAMHQSCHHSLLLRKSYAGFVKEVI